MKISSANEEPHGHTSCTPHHAFILCFFHSVFDHLLKSRMRKPTTSSSRHLASYPPRLTTYTPTYLHFYNHFYNLVLDFNFTLMVTATNHQLIVATDLQVPGRTHHFFFATPCDLPAASYDLHALYDLLVCDLRSFLLLGWL